MPLKSGFPDISEEGRKALFHFTDRGASGRGMHLDAAHGLLKFWPFRL